MAATLLTRRRWMFGGLAAGIVAAVGAGREWRLRRHPTAADLADFLRERLGHLNLAPDALDAFAADYTRRFGAAAIGVHRQLTFGGLMGAAPLRRVAPARAREAVRLERRLVSDFLRSTTYFREPPGAVVRFVAYPDPYEGPCSNPFADLTPS